MPDDLLPRRLRSLRKNDISSLLTGGLRVSEATLTGLDKEELLLLCSKKLRLAAGSSVRNLFRGDHDFPYKQLLIDVADKLTEGCTALSWTKYSLKDSHSEREIEDEIIRLFESRTSKWWENLTHKKKAQFVDGLNSVLRGDAVGKVDLADGPKIFLTQQIIENVIQNGIILGLSHVAAHGMLGSLGVSVVSQVGWLILLQTVGWMGGLKIAILGIGGYGALGGVVGTLGTAAIGGVLSLPTAAAVLDGPAYRKTVPTVIMLLAKNRMDSSREERKDWRPDTYAFEITHFGLAIKRHAADRTTPADDVPVGQPLRLPHRKI